MAAETQQGGRQAHFCYMYAAPLVKQSTKRRIGGKEAIERPLNLAVESQELMHQLSKAGKGVVWQQTVASHSTFAKTLRTNLDILHYSGTCAASSVGAHRALAGCVRMSCGIRLQRRGIASTAQRHARQPRHAQGMENKGTFVGSRIQGNCAPSQQPMSSPS